MSDEELPVIVVRWEGSGWRAAIRALGNEAVFEGPDLGDVVRRAGVVASNHLRGVLPGPYRRVTPVVIARETCLRTEELLALIEAYGSADKLNLSGCYVDRIDVSKSALDLHVAAHPVDGTPAWRDSLTGSIQLKGIILRDASLSYANLEGAELGFADLRDAVVWFTNLDKTVLWHAKFDRANIRDTTFRGADFLGADLKGVDLYHAELRGAFWRGALLDRTRMRRERLGRATGDELAVRGQKPVGPFRSPATFHDAEEGYLVLKINFDSLGRRDDARWAHVKERQMGKATHFPTTIGHEWIRQSMRRGQRRWRRRSPGRLWRFTRASIVARVRWAWLHISLFVGVCPSDIKRQIRERKGELKEEHLDRPRWFLSWCYEAACGHGERPWRPLLWAVLLSLLAFPLLYWATGALPDHGRAFTSGSPSDIDWAGWGDSIIFSLTSFGTLAFNRLQPDGALASVLAAFEGFAGVLIFALFVFTLGNRMRRS